MSPRTHRGRIEEEKRTRTRRKGRANYFRSVTLGVISVKLFVESYWITRLGAPVPVLCTAARGILREIRLIRLILLGRFHSGAARQGLSVSPPLPPLSWDFPIPMGSPEGRDEPGAVVLYLKDSQWRWCAEAISSSGNLISNVTA